MPFKPIETQEELEEVLKERLDRERSKYADYEELQKKAALYEELKQSKDEDLAQAQKKIADLEAAAEERKKSDELKAEAEAVAKETGVPVQLLRGQNKEELEEHAKAIVEAYKDDPAPKVDLGNPSSGDTSEDEKRQYVNDLFGDK